MSQPYRIDSRAVLFFIAVFMVFQFYSVKRWRAEDWVWGHEMKAYYAYLPALHVLGDITLEKTEMTTDYYGRFYFPQPGAVRGHVFKTTMGVALLETPFFLIAQSMAINCGYPMDGYSEPYRKMAIFAASFYAFFGLFFVRKTLRRFFSDAAVSLTILTLLLGTNLYYYTFHEAAMSHAYSFFLVSVFIQLTVSWHTRPRFWKMALLGLSLGLITLVRPVNGCMGLFFLLYRDPAQASLREKYALLFKHRKAVLFAAFCFVLALSPQLAYWKRTTGQWLYYSYGAETFYWSRPEILLGLFSYQKGWLVWTPVMWFAVLGLVGLKKSARGFFWPVAVALSVYIYIIFCWWSWWYGGGFGMRPMVDVSALLAIPLAVFFQYILKTRILVLPVLGLWIFLLGLNVFQTNQYILGKLHWCGTTKKIYWQMFLNDYPEQDFSGFLKEPDVDDAMKGGSGM